MRSLRLTIACWLSLVLLLSLAFFATAAPPISLEVILDKGVPLTAPRRWGDLLTEAGFTNLRMRSSASGENPAVRTNGSGDRASYSVTGVLNANDELILPGAKIRFGDRQALKTWQDKLRDGGEQGLTAKKVAFGLTAPQLLELRDDLKVTVAFKTKGEKTRAMLDKIADGLKYELQADGKASDAVASDDPVLDELQGFSRGTALAAILRPLGCVFRPEKELGSPVKYVVRTSAEESEPWPIGWETKDSPGRVVPNFHKTLNSEITDFVLADAIDAIQKRVEVPILYDHNNMLRQRVEINKIKVSSEKGRRSYARIFDEILYQAKLKYELRLDDADRPFLWITTLKQK